MTLHKPTLFSLLLIISLLLYSAQAAEKDQAIQNFIEQTESKWMDLPESFASGARATILQGPLDQHGIHYELRVHLSKDGIIKPHSHPDTRYITVLAGELTAGRGKDMDAKHATRYPAGSYFIVPAGLVHFAQANSGQVVYQESGIGPTANFFPEEQTLKQSKLFSACE